MASPVPAVNLENSTIASASADIEKSILKKLSFNNYIKGRMLALKAKEFSSETMLYTLP